MPLALSTKKVRVITCVGVGVAGTAVAAGRVALAVGEGAAWVVGEGAAWVVGTASAGVAVGDGKIVAVGEGATVSVGMTGMIGGGAGVGASASGVPGVA